MDMFAMILTRVFIVREFALRYHEIKGGFPMAILFSKAKTDLLRERLPRETRNFSIEVINLDANTLLKTIGGHLDQPNLSFHSFFFMSKMYCSPTAFLNKYGGITCFYGPRDVIL